MKTSDPETITASIGLNLAGTRTQFEITVPKRQVALQELLPIFRSVAETIITQAVDDEHAQGLSISCRSGCGACCRQLVPINEVEARRLLELVESFDAPRRSVIQKRFTEARARLEESGLLEKLAHPERFTDDELRPFGIEYFHLGIPCPFLEKESCSIYEERPIACREYLVTSPAEHCAHPTAETVNCVPLPAKVSTAVTRIGEDPTRRFVRWVPLILALEWAEKHPDDLGERSGPEWLREFFERLTGRSIPSPPASTK